jgi:hypothetical protein
MATKTYNGKEVNASFGSINLRDGAPEDGEFCTVSRTTATSEMSALVNGAVLVMRNDRTGSITVTLSAASDVNDELSDVMAAQEAAGVLDARAFSLTDNSGRTKHECGKVVLAGYPADGFSGSIATRAWTFWAPDLKMDPRGSNDL